MIKYSTLRQFIDRTHLKSLNNKFIDVHVTLDFDKNYPGYKSLKVVCEEETLAELDYNTINEILMLDERKMSFHYSSAFLDYLRKTIVPYNIKTKNVNENLHTIKYCFSTNANLADTMIECFFVGIKEKMNDMMFVVSGVSDFY